jgi:uncharacterized protein
MNFVSYPEIWRQMSEGFQLSSRWHGPPHWKQVEANGLEIHLSSGADETVVRLFAVLHDSQRWSDGYDPQHGFRAAEVAALLRGDLFVIEDARMELLEEALRWHNHGQVSTDPTIGTCWDADRMDLIRMGMIPDSDLMSTAYARQWAASYEASRRGTDPGPSPNG